MYIMALSNLTLTIAAWYGVAVVKLCVINCNGSRTMRHAFSQTPIMMHMRVYLGWQNLETHRQNRKAMMVYKSLNYLAPNYMSSKFILRSDIFNSYNLRDSENKFAIPSPRTNYYIETASATAGLFCETICPLM